MCPATTTPEEVRAALLDLALVAGAHLRPAARPAREPLRQALHHANEVLKAELVEVLAPEDIRDPEQLILRFIHAGGDWHGLVAAVSRNALRGATAPRRDKEREERP